MKIDRRFGDHFVLMDSALWCGCLIYITVLGSWPLIWTIRAPYKLRTETSLPYLCRILMLQTLTSLPFFSLNWYLFFLFTQSFLDDAKIASCNGHHLHFIITTKFGIPGPYSLPLPFALLGGSLRLLLFSIISQLLEGDISFFLTASLSHWKLLHLIKVDS